MFYNVSANIPDQQLLRLSDAFMEPPRQDAYDDGRNDGFAEGEKQHLVSLVCKKMTKSKSIEQIADELEEDIPLIQKIYDIATEFSPEYDVDKIMEKLEYH